MRTLSNFRDELDLAINKLGINSVEVQSLKELLATSLYLNESESTSISLESTPVTCLQLNSSLAHACGRGYSVYRGMNPRVKLTGLTCTESRSVKKYDEFLSIQGYKLVYAQDYEFLINYEYDVDVILTKSVELGYFRSKNKYAYTITKKDISEDFMMYTVGDNGMNVLPIVNEVHNSVDYDQTIIALTYCDFGIKLFNLAKFNEDLTYYYRYLPYITELVDFVQILNSINRIPYFSFTQLSYNSESGESGDGFTNLQGIERNTDKDKIYLLSLIENSGLVKSTDSLNAIVYRYLNEYITICKSFFTFNNEAVSDVDVYYQLADKNVGIPSDKIQDLLAYVKVAYYNPGMKLDMNSFKPAYPVIYSDPGFKFTYKASRSYAIEIINALEKLQSKYIGGLFDMNLVSKTILGISDDIQYVSISEGRPDQEIDLGDYSYPDLINLNGSYGSLISNIELKS